MSILPKVRFQLSHCIALIFLQFQSSLYCCTPRGGVSRKLSGAGSSVENICTNLCLGQRPATHESGSANQQSSLWRRQRKKGSVSPEPSHLRYAGGGQLWHGLPDSHHLRAVLVAAEMKSCQLERSFTQHSHNIHTAFTQIKNLHPFRKWCEQELPPGMDFSNILTPPRPTPFLTQILNPFLCHGMVPPRLKRTTKLPTCASDDCGG